jgi:Co/Zn/Cd efflux system component
MFLHILSDALGSVGVIVSSLLIQYYGNYDKKVTDCVK